MKFAWLGLAALILAGCQGNDPAPASESPMGQAAHAKVAVVAVPGTKNSTDIALVVRGDEPIKVGSSPEDAMKEYVDTKIFGFGSDKLPPGFDDRYRAQTWECSRYGFGVITYDDRVEAALYQQDKFTQDRVDDIVKAHTDAMPNITPTWIQGKHVNYWFWEGGKQRLMVCAFDSGRNGIQMTVAMGDDVVMDGLGISPQLAQKNSIVVDMMMNRTGSPPKPSTPVDSSRSTPVQ